MMLRRTVLALALGAALGSATAATVTVSGAGFDVSFDDGLLGLFGTPTLVGDTLSWFPSGSPGFVAQTGSGVDVENATFSLRVTAHDGFRIASLDLQESGDYFFFGSGAGVSASGQLRVTPLPGAVQTAALVPGAPFVANAPLDFTTSNWSAAATVTLPAGVTLANASIENILAAYVTPGSFPAYAFIEKKEVFLGIDIVPVPEPGTYALMLAGVAAVGFVAARRRRGG